MIPIEKLLAIKTIVSHLHCADGTASALILRDVLPRAEIVFVQHNTPELHDLEVKPGMIFVDMAPPASRAQEFLNAGAICLDHHRSGKEIVESFGPLGVFADEDTEPGVSGATLAFREVWRPLCRHAQDLAIDAAGMGRRHEGLLPYVVFWKHFADLAGIYDTWQTKDVLFRKAREQAETLRFWPWEWLEQESVQTLEDRLVIGAVLVERQDATANRALKGAYRFTTDQGTRVTVVQGADAINDVAEAAGEGTDLVMAFRYEHNPSSLHGGKLIWSCRGRGAYDVSKLAVHYGGGGHKGAGGFSLQVLHDMDPFARAKVLVDRFEEGI